jgi:drug/metabolite transporter (DMT)-like permease
MGVKLLTPNYNNMKILGIILIVAGILMAVFRGVSFTHEKEVADIGPIELNKKERETVAWPTYAGIAVAVCGVVILLASRNRRTA